VRPLLRPTEDPPRQASCREMTPAELGRLLEESAVETAGSVAKNERERAAGGRWCDGPGYHHPDEEIIRDPNRRVE